jgi:predicted dehydrogenase
MSHTTRRAFLTAAGAAVSAGCVLGANDKVNVAVVGVGGRGNAHINEYVKLPGARIAALCDVDQASLAKRSGVGEAPDRRSAQRLRGHAEALRRFRRRCGLDHRAQSLARAFDHLGVSGR